jgi:hypothetical protein
MIPGTIWEKQSISNPVARIERRGTQNSVIVNWKSTTITG